MMELWVAFILCLYPSVITEYLPSVTSSTFTNVLTYLTFKTNRRGRGCYHPHFTDEEVEEQKLSNFPRCHSQ